MDDARRARRSLARAPRARAAPRDRRLRHRPLVARPPARDAGDDAQDRPLVRRRPPGRPRAPACSSRRCSGWPTGSGCRPLAEGIETEAQRALPRRARLPARAGLPLLPPVAAAQIEPLVPSPPPRRVGQVTRFIAASSSACSPDSTMPRSRVDRVPHVDEAGVERREAEADRVGRAEVGDDVRALDERPADRARRRGGAATTCAPRRCGVARRAEREAERRQPRVVEVDRELGERAALARTPVDARLGQHLARPRRRPPGRGSAASRPGTAPIAATGP